MNKNYKFFILPLIFAAIFFAPCQSILCETQNNKESVRTTILFLNDIHGHLSPFETTQNGAAVEVGGITRIASLINKIKTENKKTNTKTFILIAGDILQGTPLSTVFKGKPDIKILNNIGVNAFTVGNHEFDFGADNFLLLKKNARFPFISSNIIWKDTGKLICAPLTALPLNKNLSITVIGATTQELLTTTNPLNVEKIDVLDSVITVKQYFEKQKLKVRSSMFPNRPWLERQRVGSTLARPDVTSGRASTAEIEPPGMPGALAAVKGPVILLSHSNFRTDAKIAENVQQLCAIIGGHDQILFNPYRKIGAVPIFQAFEKGKYLGRIDLSIDTKTGKTTITNWNYVPITDKMPSDKKTERILEQYNSKLDVKFKETIGESKTFLDGERERIRYEETNLGDWVTDIMREFTSVRIALINAGSIRASINEGPITIEEIFKMMPYPNEIVTMDITGKEILEALTRSVKGTREDEDGGFLHVSGISFTINGKSIENIMVGNQPLNLQQTYKTAISDFLAAGGDGYTVFKHKPCLSTGLPLRELVIDTVRKKQTIDAHAEGRISRNKK